MDNGMHSLAIFNAASNVYKSIEYIQIIDQK